MTTTKKNSAIVNFGAWLLSFIVFIVGFWHSHLGLKEMRPFESEYGSLIVAGIFLLLILISYNIAVNGRKIAIVFYIIGGLFYFVFNLNYFYPSYLSRKLINEETDQIKETLTIQKNQLNSIAQVNKSKYFEEISDLVDYKTNILTEIIGRDGFGGNATQNLEKFKKISGSELTGERKIPKNPTPAQVEQIYYDWEKKLDDAIINYVAKTISGDEKNKLEIVYAHYDLEKFYKLYMPILDSISNDEKKIYLDSLKDENYIPSKQIKTLKIVVDKINQTDIRVNTALNKPQPPIYRKDDPKSKRIGRFEHTIASIGDRINKIDTWGIILLCLFIDLLVPLFIYLMIRKNENEINENNSFWDNITGKKKPSTF